MSEFQKLLDEAVRKLVYDYSIQIENLTEQQTVSALRQAIECGDFQRLISPTGQQVVYEPFRREHESLAQIGELTEENQRLRGLIAELESAEHEKQITQVWRHKVHVLVGILEDVKTFLKQIDYSKGQSDELLRRIDEVKL